MHRWITLQLQQLGVPDSQLLLMANVSGFLLLLVFAWLAQYVVKHRLVSMLQKLVEKSKNKWDDLLVSHRVFEKLAMLVPLFILFVLAPAFLDEESSLIPALAIIVKVALVFQVARCIAAILDVIRHIYQAKAKTRYMPLSAAVQVIKLAIYLVATILAVSVIIDRSPIYLLSGLGALTAVLLLVFQDTIKGLVASIQIAANKMVAPGDWIELPKYGADGDVLEIGLNTVKVQNFDRTVTTVPTYALISGSFKNWRDMFNSGGRRIKRAIPVDVQSIRFYQPDEIERLKQFKLLEPYLKQKQQELCDHRNHAGIDEHDRFNQRQLTNIGTYRAYIEAYLKQHEKVHKEMTCMVRQLAPQPDGLPLELYFFSNDQNWVNYEGIQADIFDHLYAVAPEFDLRIFQHPTGHDWQRAITK
ncbi:mechanosensitive ion channel family protein [Thalassotalea euphylliae]|uniref:mechanosensitive ion channel family protein n=1 Tax=Thalassotalea euphylliae TaxID=1655234 RepID=UPI0036334DEF